MTPCNSAGAISRLAVRHRKSRPGPGGVHRHYRRVKPCPMRRSRNLPIGMAWRAECRFEGGEADNHRGLHRSTFRPRGSYVPGPRVRVLTTACALPPSFPPGCCAPEGIRTPNLLIRTYPVYGRPPMCVGPDQRRDEVRGSARETAQVCALGYHSGRKGHPGRRRRGGRPRRPLRRPGGERRVSLRPAQAFAQRCRCRRAGWSAC